jgi:signal transduction histidine kinase
VTRPGRLFWPWLVWAAVCIALMGTFAGQETIPFHLGYVGLALAAGFDVWSPRRAVFTLGGYTLLSGAILVRRAADGVIAWEETAEIPLMCLIVGMALWHILKRNEAIARVSRLVEREQAQMARRERLVRIVSHEMRTPLAIAGGYVDLLRAQHLPEPAEEDLDVVREELDRSALAVDRLLRLIRSQDNLPLLHLDIDSLLEETVQRWRVVAERDWCVHAAAGVQKVNVDRMRACIDTLIENAVRYTSEGDTIRVFAYQQGDTYVVGVADSGAGFTDGQIEAINATTLDSPEAPPIISDPRSQTGLGLSLVREGIEWRGGRLLAGRAPEGGAEVRIVCPIPAGYANGPAAVGVTAERSTVTARYDEVLDDVSLTGRRGRTG